MENNMAYGVRFLVLSACLLACATPWPGRAGPGHGGAELVPLYGGSDAGESDAGGSDARGSVAELVLDQRFCALSGTRVDGPSDGPTHQLRACASRVSLPPGAHHVLIGSPVRAPSEPKMWFALRFRAEPGGRYLVVPSREFVPEVMPFACVVTELRGRAPLRLAVRERSTGRIVGRGKQATPADFARHATIPHRTWQACREISLNGRATWIGGGSQGAGPQLQR